MAAEKLVVKENVLTSIAIDVMFDDIYTLWDWKEIKNCPGRYVLKKKVANELSPLNFMKNTLQKWYEENKDNDIKPIGINNDHLFELKETFGLKNDKIFLIFFKDQGGIMTYQKPTNNKEDHEMKQGQDLRKHVYVHTLNKPAGMLRKLTSMNVNYQYNKQTNYVSVKEKCANK
eukprot:421371_1